MQIFSSLSTNRYHTNELLIDRLLPVDYDPIVPPKREGNQEFFKL